MPVWFREKFLLDTGLADRDLAHLPDSQRTHAAAETAWYWSSPFIHRAVAHLGTFALEEGIELRSPLADRRIVEFALRRPREERAAGPETKRLLRAAMEGLLPDAVLAPRPQRTGTTDGFSHDRMRREFPALLRDQLSQPLRLEELGIVNSKTLRRAAASYRERGQSELRVALLWTYHTEQWLRMNTPSAGHAKPENPLPHSRNTAASYA
jgi:hypothetical protein